MNYHRATREKFVLNMLLLVSFGKESQPVDITDNALTPAMGLPLPPKLQKVLSLDLEQAAFDWDLPAQPP